ncbi:MAG: T9SS type A sorting domain-containing protein [Saprospiraceae bacterium]
MKTILSTIIFMGVFHVLANSQCGPLIENPETITLTGTIAQDISYTNKIIVIGDNQNVLFEGDINFINCRVIFNKLLLYKQPNFGHKMIRFIDSKMEFGEGTAIRSWIGFNPQKVQIVIDNCCLTGDRTGELLHIDEGGLRFVNNTVNITNTAHMFHLVNLNETLENEIYGNTINITIDQFFIDNFNDPVILVDKRPGLLKIGDNGQALNIITTNATGFRFFKKELNSEIVIENTVFNSPRIGVYLSAPVEKLEISNCVFNGTGNGAKGISYSIEASVAELKIINSEFNTNTIGIDLPSCYNTLIEDNSFNYSKTGIYNGFANQSLGDGEISNNQFLNGEIDIHSTGAWNGLKIENNNFSGTDYGILADGDNIYEINNNTFYNSYAGSILFSNGDNENSHIQNQFNNIVGIHSLNENFGYEFMDNCFNSSGGDVYIDGTISLMIGEESREAGNCFTKQNIPDITATGTLFEYYRPDNKINTCNDPVTQSNYQKLIGDDVQQEVCGSNISFQGSGNNYCNFNPKTITCAEAKILSTQLLQQINFILNSSSYTNPVLKEFLRKRLALCRFRLLKIMMRCFGDDPDGPKLAGEGFVLPTDALNAANEIKNSSNIYEQATYIGLSIELGMLQEATDFISTMSTSDEEMLDFIDVQLVNIAYIQQKDSFHLSVSDSLMLVNNGEKDFPLAAYARGLYYQLTGNVMYPDIPILTFDRSRKEVMTKDHIFPNSFYDQLYLDCLDNGYLRFVDITGKVIITQQIVPGRISFDTSTWSPGMYIVHIQNKDGLATSYKVIKQ